VLLARLLVEKLPGERLVTETLGLVTLHPFQNRSNPQVYN